MSETNPELREADRQHSQLVVVQVQMLKAGQVPQVIWQTVELVFTQVHLHQVGQVAELWLHERHPAIEKYWNKLLLVREFETTCNLGVWL